MIQIGEGDECDDGHMPPDDGDGCNSSCTVEAGWSCTGEPSVCIPTFNLDGSSSPGSSIPDCVAAGGPGTPCTVGNGNEGILSDTISFATARTVTGINIDMDISHPNKGDLLVEITSPGGTTVMLHNQSSGDVADIAGNYELTLPVDGPGEPCQTSSAVLATAPGR